MVDSSADTDLWLNSQVKLLVVEDMIRGDKENGTNGVKTEPGYTFCFPAEFPYEFDFLSETSARTYPVESIKDSVEAGNNDDDDDLLANLTRRLTQSSIRETRKLPVSSYYACEKPEKNWGSAHSPQSTLTGMESWSARSAVSSYESPNGPSHVPSPTSTPFAVKNDNYIVIHAAAGQVGRLKPNEVVVPQNSVYQTRALFSTPHTATQVAKSPDNVMYQAQTITQTNQLLNQTSKEVRPEQILKQQWSSVWARRAEVSWLLKQQQIQNMGQNNGYYSGQCVHTKRLPQTAWPPVLAPHAMKPSRSTRSATGGVPPGSGVKRKCAGTGVFLPRRYDRTYSEPHKTSCSTLMFPNKLVNTPNLDTEFPKETTFTSGFPTEHDVVVMSSRDEVLFQRRRPLRQNGAVNHDIRLPQEWTY